MTSVKEHPGAPHAASSRPATARCGPVHSANQLRRPQLRGEPHKKCLCSAILPGSLIGPPTAPRWCGSPHCPRLRWGSPC